MMTPRCREQYRVLVVDDDPSVLATYGRLLRRAGYDVVCEDDPLSVLQNGRAEGIDLLLLDYRMPAMDGLTMLAELRQRECRARCVLVSAFLDTDVRIQARNLGVDRVMEKPVDVGALRRVMGELLPLPEEPPSKAAGC
jgi:DNA-binding response OmpR family regulator